MIRAVLVLVALALYILLLGPPFILHCLITGSPEALYRAGVGAARVALWVGGIRVRASGLENIPAGVCIFVANHISNIDPPAVVISIPRRVALLGKKEVFRVPIVGRALLLADMVPVDRTDRAAAIASVEKAKEHLQRGVSFLIYPEGTRSPDGRLRPFKKGSFMMAIEAAVPVVPVAVICAHKLMRKGELALRPGEVGVRFLAPIDASQHTLETRDALIQQVHDAVAEALPEDQKPIRKG